MKFLLSVLKMVLPLGVLAGVVVLVGPELMLGLAAMQLRESVANVKSQVAKSGSASYCNDPFGGRAKRGVTAFQVRFENDREYVVEAVCGTFATNKVISERFVLPHKVRKASGYSGIVWRGENRLDTNSVVELELNGRRWRVGVEEGKIVAGRVWFRDLVEKGEQAINSCAGWGYMCCSRVNQVGDGEQMTQGVSDCLSSCYQSCLNLPVITTLISEPYFDENRVVRIGGGDMVKFSWNSLDLDGKVMKVKVVLGDGNDYEFEGETGSVEHAYDCQSEVCEYGAYAVAYDDAGLESRVGDIAKLNVVVLN